jgi:hypothetical protein
MFFSTQIKKSMIKRYKITHLGIDVLQNVLKHLFEGCSLVYYKQKIGNLQIRTYESSSTLKNL